MQVQRIASEATATVIALDATGRPVRDYAGTVTLASSDPAATLPAAYTFTSGDRGLRVFGVALLTAGGVTVTAADAGRLTAAHAVPAAGTPEIPPGRRHRG